MPSSRNGCGVAIARRAPKTSLSILRLLLRRRYGGIASGGLVVVNVRVRRTRAGGLD